MFFLTVVCCSLRGVAETEEILPVVKHRETYQNNARAWASDDKYRPIPIKSEPSSNNDSTPPTGVSTSLDPPSYPSNAPIVYQPVEAPTQQTIHDTTMPIQTDIEPSNTSNSNDLKIDPQPIIDSNIEQSEDKKTFSDCD